MDDPIPPINTDLVNVILSRPMAKSLLGAVETGSPPSKPVEVAVERALVTALSKPSPMVNP